MSVDPGSLYHRDFTIEELGEASITIGNNKHLRNVGRKVSPEEF